MATIHTSIQLEDRMSRQFQAINLAMLSTIDYMMDLNNASENMIDTTALQHAQTQLQGLEASFNQVEQEILQSEHAQENFNQDIQNGNRFASKLLGTIGAIAGTYLSIQGLGNVVDLSDQMTDTTARISLLVEEMPVLPSEHTIDVGYNIDDKLPTLPDQQVVNMSAQGIDDIQNRINGLNTMLSLESALDNSQIQQELKALEQSVVNVNVQTNSKDLSELSTALANVRENEAYVHLSVENARSLDALQGKLNAFDDVSINVSTQTNDLQQIRSYMDNLNTSFVMEAQVNNEQVNRELNTLNDAVVGVGVEVAVHNVDQLEQLSVDLAKIEQNEAYVNLSVQNAQLLDDVQSKITSLETNANVNIAVNGLSEVELAQQLIYEAANRAYASFKDTADLVTRIGMNAGDAFGSTAEVIAFAELVQKQFGIAGASATEASNATLQLSQALASGVLRGDELNSIFEQAPNLIHSIADYMGEPIGRIRELAKDGLITADVVKNAMFAASDDINNRFSSMPTTWSQIWTNFKNDALWAFRDVLSYINSLANSDTMIAFISSIKTTLYSLAEVVMWVLQTMASVGSFIYNHWSILEPIIGGVTAALIANAAAWAWNNREIAINAFMVMTAGLRNVWFVATTVASTWATYGFTAAMAALSLAIAANPIGWLIGAVIVLISAFYLAVAVVNHFAGTSISATGIIAGAFMVLAAYIHNRIAFLWNTFASIAEFFVNVWQHPMYSVRKLFYNLASDVLDQAIAMTHGWDSFATNFVNAIIGAVNGAIRAWNRFIDILPDDIGSALGLGKGTEFTYRESITSDLGNIKGALGDWVGEPPTDYWEAPKMEMKDLGTAWDKGYNWGADLFGQEQESKDKKEKQITEGHDDLMALSGLNEAARALDDLKDSGKDTANNTKKLADSATILEDDLKYMRDLSAGAAINRYTIDYKIDIKNDNHINSELDIDGIVDRFGEKVEEVASSLAEVGSMDV